MASIDPRVTAAIASWLERASKDFRITRAYLFGSRVRGTGDEWSDIDLALVSPDFRGRPWLDLHAQLYGYKWTVAPDVEPLALTPEQIERATPADFVGGVILAEGILVWEDGRLLVPSSGD